MDLSIIVPVGRPQSSANTVRSILSQVYLPNAIEIILVGAELSSLQAEFSDVRIRYVVLDSRRNPAATRAAGVEAAQGQVYLFVDDDIELAPHYLECLWPRIVDTPALGAVGARLPCKVTTYFSRVTDFSNFWSQQSMDSGTRDWLYSALLAIPAAVYHEVGGFNTAFAVGEDVDLTSRIKSGGYEVLYDAKCIGYHDHKRVSFLSAASYFWNNGRFAKYIFHQTHHLRVYSLRKVLRDVAVCLWSTLRCNQKALGGMLLYLPGILVMYALFNISLEYHYQRYMRDYIGRVGAASLVSGSSRNTSLYGRVIVSRNNGKHILAYVYLLACYFKELTFLLPVLLGFILYILMK